MGNTSSVPQPAGIGETTSLTRDPTYESVSGLNYSGRIYTNQFKEISKDICNITVNPTQIGDVMPNGISSTTLPVDNSTHRITQNALQGYVNTLIMSGKVPGERSDGDLEKQLSDDKAFYASIQTEYCFYESRYKSALDQFLTLVSAPNGADSAAITAMLTTTIALNARLNSLLEILNYINNTRAQNVNDRNPLLESANSILHEKVGILKKQYDYLNSSDVRTRTQEEMMRFSAEKNQAMNIQILFFVALNVVAVGTIITVYRNVRA